MLAAIEGIPMKEKIIEMLGNAVYIDDDASWAPFLADTTKEESE
jgi:hypothetical protein